MSASHSEELASLIVEVCNRAENDCWVNGFGPSFLIKLSFARWVRELKRARRIHRSTETVRVYSKWWNTAIGKIGNRKPLTRRLLAQQKTAPRNWSLH